MLQNTDFHSPPRLSDTKDQEVMKDYFVCKWTELFLNTLKSSSISFLLLAPLSSPLATGSISFSRVPLIPPLDRPHPRRCGSPPRTCPPSTVHPLQDVTIFVGGRGREGGDRVSKWCLEVHLCQAPPSLFPVFRNHGPALGSLAQGGRRGLTFPPR